MTTEVPQSDVYHKLGKLEGMMQTLSEGQAHFIESVKGLTARIDKLETRQNSLESMVSSQRGGVSTAAWAIPTVCSVLVGLLALGTANQDLREALTHEGPQQSTPRARSSNQ